MDKETLTIKVVESVSSLNETMIDQWRDLENSAFESNIYLSPDFVLPSLQHLLTDITPIFIFVFYQDGTDSKMVFAAIFNEIKPSIKHPFNILASYTTPHSFLSGFLLDAHLHVQALDSFFQYWSKQKRWHALDLWLHWYNTPQGQQINTCAKSYNIEWILIRQQERAAIFSHPEIEPITKISKSLLKNITKKRKQLAFLGELEYRYIDNIEAIPQAIQSFLELEHQSWKGRNGSSLLSRPEENDFFSCVTLTLAKQKKVIFTEILLSGKVIASTVNYISGSAFFAFKTARDETLDQYSLGVLNEISLIEKIPECLSSFHIFDSGAETGSYMDNIWKDKILLTSGYFTNNFLFRAYLFIRKLTRITK